MGTIQYVNRRRFINTGKRYEFDDEVKDWFKTARMQLDYNTDICHRVSYKFIADALMNALNFFVYNIDAIVDENGDVDFTEEDVVEETIYYLCGTVLSVILTDVELVQLEQSQIDNIENPIEELSEIFIDILDNRGLEYDGERYVVLIEDIKAEMNNYIQAYADEDFEQLDLVASNMNVICERLIKSLNSNINNLFIGISGWNRSIGECFDPKYSVINKEVEYAGNIIGALNDVDAVVFSILVEATKPGGDNFGESELALYAAVNQNKEIVLYSSAHRDSLPEIEALDTNVIIVYYNCFRKRYMPVDQNWQDNIELLDLINS